MLGEALGSLDGDRPEEVDLVWGPLKRIAASGNGVDMQRLVMRMREGVIPDELHVAQTAPITVSTVHRAKGLEFERVIVVPDGWRAPFDDDDARTLFVALSRTIDDLLQEQLPDVGGKLRKHQWLDRWLWTGWKHWQVRGLEVRPDDVHRVDPPGVGPGGGDPVEIQQALAEQVHPGDSVEIVLLRPKVDGGAIYQIKHAAGTIGLMADAFGREMQKIRRGQYPHRIAGVSVDSVRSVGGDASVSQQAGLGPSGAWLVPSLAGLGQFE
jgi:hypothetical protein